MIGNNYFLFDVALICLFAWVFILISYTLGILLFNVPSVNTTRKSFYNSVLGALFIIDLYSIFCSNFRTVNLCSFAILLYLIFKNNNRFNYKEVQIKSLSPFLYILPITVIIYSMYQYGENVAEDIKYYSKITYNLGLSGNENFYHFYNTYDSKFNGIIPYHYIEFWLASFFHSLTNSLSVFSLKNFSYPFLISLISFGVLSFSNQNKVITFSLFICVSLIPLGSYLVSLNTFGWTIFTDFWLRPNLISYYLIFILLFCSVLDNNWWLFYIFISIGLTFSIVIIPAIISSLILLGITKIYFKLSDLKSEFRLFTIPILTLIGIIIIYKLFGSKVNISTEFNLIKELSYNLVIWKAVLVTFSVLLLELLIVPSIFLLFNKRILKNKNIGIFIYFLIFINLTGLVLFQSLTQVDNSYQFAYFGYAGTGVLFTALIIFISDKYSNTIIKATIAVFLLPTLIFLLYGHNFNISLATASISSEALKNENVSSKWVEDFKSYLQKNPTAKGGFIYSKQELSSLDPKLRNCLTRQVGSYICNLTDNCNLVSLTYRDTMLFDYDKNQHKTFTKNIIWLNTFPDFNQKINSEEYLESKQVDYFICDINKKIKNDHFSIIYDSVKMIKLIHR